MPADMPADKQNRRPYLLPLLGIPILGILLWADPWNLLRKDERTVALKHAEEVDRIVLRDAFATAELNRKGDSWYLYGTEKVSPVPVENLLIAASRLEVASIIDVKSLKETLDQQEELRDITYFKGERVLLSYGFVKTSGSYLVLPPGSGQAYYVSLPGYGDLDLDRVFSANPDHYREHILIDLQPSDIAAIDIELDSGEAFRFTQDEEGTIRCEILNDQTRLPEGPPNELAERLLFSYFTSIRYEGHTSIPADSLRTTPSLYQPLARIGVESFGGGRHSMDVYSYRDSINAEPHLFQALVLFDEQQEALLVNYIYLDVLMRGLSHYFGEK
jgi:hypothetical protein